MREATGNGLLTMMVTSIIAVIMIFFVGSLSYSKSFRIKNYIIGEIEENRGWSTNVQNSVDKYLKDAGYNIAKSNKACPIIQECNKDRNGGTAINSTNRNYDYCIYHCGTGTSDFYKVITYMKFEFPVIGDVMKFTVKGETKSFNNFN